MVPGPTLSNRRVALLALAVGLLLLTAPVWIGVVDLQKPVSTYERIEVTTEDDRLRYAEPPRMGDYRPISPELGCALGQPRTTRRLCDLEAGLAAGDGRPVAEWTDDPNEDPRSPPHRYEYLLLNGAIYEPTATVGSEPGDPPPGETDDYPVFLDLERVDADVALQELSIDGRADFVPDVVRRAATDGSATTRGSVDAPRHPIRLADGSTYRVARTDTDDPPAWNTALHSLARYLAPVLGLLALHAAWRRVTVTVTYREPRW